MLRTLTYSIALLLVTGLVRADEAGLEGDSVLPGMSIIGNDEAPKSLVIVPWKSSGLGDTLDVLRALDDGRQPVDRDVFTRELDYYQLRATSPDVRRSGSK